LGAVSFLSSLFLQLFGIVFTILLHIASHPIREYFFRVIPLYIFYDLWRFKLRLLSVAGVVGLL